MPARAAAGRAVRRRPRLPAAGCAEHRERSKQLFERIVAEEGQTLLGWRDVPTDDSPRRPERRRGGAACSEQLFIGPRATWRSAPTSCAFERKLYVIRKRVEHAVDVLDHADARAKFFYVASLRANTLIYKGMLTADADRADVPGSDATRTWSRRWRWSTSGSAPTRSRPGRWRIPYRYIAHNGEINTLRGNINWMHAREALLAVRRCSATTCKKILPIIREGGSDSAMFDNVLEFLVMAGRSLPHAILMMIPEPWAGNEAMRPEKRAFYEYHSWLMEPWDGPASIAFTDGTVIGAVLDRNGLRPSRYYVTKDDLVIMASEVGVLDIPPRTSCCKERLQPGRMFLVDTAQGRIVVDEEIKRELAAEQPVRRVAEEHLVDLEDLPAAPYLPQPNHETVLQRQQAFGYTHEDLQLLLAPMARDGEEPLGSMGTDTPLAVLSDRPRLLYDYFKQLFAQVTNPPLDAIREELVTSMESTIGPGGQPARAEARGVPADRAQDPILDNEELAKLRHVDAARLPVDDAADAVRRPAKDGPGLERGDGRAVPQGERGGRGGLQHPDPLRPRRRPRRAPIPSLLATAGVHHHLIREGTRTQCALVVEIGRGARSASLSRC